MKYIALKTNYALALMITGILVASPAIADKPSWAGGSKGEENEHSDRHDGKKSRHRHDDEESHRDRDESVGRGGEYFGDHQRMIANDYYREQFRTGRCPPGLAKKHNGCMPPGQARKWSVGKPLPHDVEYHDLPPALVVKIGQPPAGHRYVQVAADILMVAVGTGMVVDAIEDLGKK